MLKAAQKKIPLAEKNTDDIDIMRVQLHEEANLPKYHLFTLFPHLDLHSSHYPLCDVGQISGPDKMQFEV